MQTSIEALSRLERRLNMAVPAEQIDREVEETIGDAVPQGIKD